MEWWNASSIHRPTIPTGIPVGMFRLEKSPWVPIEPIVSEKISYEALEFNS